MTNPPRTKQELFERVRTVRQHGWYDLPDSYGGTGAPGMFLEDLLGLTAGAMDIPDAVGWELKWYTDRTNLVTLFHKEADGPPAIMRYMVRRFGWEDSQGRLSFRHTIRGRSDRFRVEDSGGQLVVRPLRGNGPVPYWSHEELIAAAGAKLRRLLMVKGERDRKAGRVRFLQVDAFEVFNLVDFVYEVLRGEIAIDFDCREARPGSAGLRNHGTKFRIAPGSICRFVHEKREAVVPFRSRTSDPLSMRERQTSEQVPELMPS